MKKADEWIGYTLVGVVAFCFDTVYQTIYQSFQNNVFGYHSDYHDLHTPYGIVQTLVTIFALANFAFLSVYVSEETTRFPHKRFMMRRSLYGLLIFVTLYFIFMPVALWVSMGSAHAPYIFDLSMWKNHFLHFITRNNLFAIVPTSMMMVVVENLRCILSDWDSLGYKFQRRSKHEQAGSTA